MATSHVYYLLGDTTDPKVWDTVCLACGIRAVMQDKDLTLEAQGGDYESHQCSHCDRFISDQIDI